jgi:hypothetical protein
MLGVFKKKLIARDWVFASDGWVLRDGLEFRADGRTIHGTPGWQDHYLLENNQLIFLGNGRETAVFDIPNDVRPDADFIILRGVETNPDTGEQKNVRLYSREADQREPDFRYGDVTPEELSSYFWQWQSPTEVFIRNFVLNADQTISNGDERYHLRWRQDGPNLHFFGEDNKITAELLLTQHNADGIVYEGNLINLDTGEREPRLLVARPFRFVDPKKEEHNAPHALAKRDIVLTTFFVNMVDAQRNQVVEGLNGLLNAVRRLAESVQAQGQQLVVISNLPAEEVPTESFEYFYFDGERYETSVYWARWMAESGYLRQHEDIGRVFHVDTTDVEMLKNPFPQVADDTLYVGTQSDQLMQYNVRRSGRDNVWRDWINRPGQWEKQLLNPGVIGGTRAVVLELISSMVEKWALNWIDEKNGKDQLTGAYEMAFFNMVSYEEFADRLTFGPKVTTHFDAFGETGTAAWFRHK